MIADCHSASASFLVPIPHLAALRLCGFALNPGASTRKVISFLDIPRHANFAEKPCFQSSSKVFKDKNPLGLITDYSFPHQGLGSSSGYSFPKRVRVSGTGKNS